MLQRDGTRCAVKSTFARAVLYDAQPADGARAPWVHVHATWLPRTVFGRLHAVCAFLRCIWLALVLLVARPGFDAVVVDQVAAPVPVIRALSSSKARRRVRASPRQCSCQLTAAPDTTQPRQVLFYCHFPDLLLASRGSRLRSLYRAPLDIIEQSATGRVRRRRVLQQVPCLHR